jgi:hypothetical protein
VAGGLFNELWRLDTESGAFAVKRMIVNAGSLSFVDNVETAFTVERRAWAADVATPSGVAAGIRPYSSPPILELWLARSRTSWA